MYCILGKGSSKVLPLWVSYFSTVPFQNKTGSRRGREALAPKTVDYSKSTSTAQLITRKAAGRQALLAFALCTSRGENIATVGLVYGRSIYFVQLA